MAFAHKYGTCSSCKEWGALWTCTVMRKRFWLFGPLVSHKVYLCDECDSLNSFRIKRLANLHSDVQS